jgi:hypothetical protein
LRSPARMSPICCSRARRREKTGNRVAIEPRCGPSSDSSPAVDRKHSAGIAGRRSRRVFCVLGHSLSKSAARERSEARHRARGVELARTIHGRRAFSSHGRAVRPCSRDTIHARGRRAGVKGNTSKPPPHAAFVLAHQHESNATRGPNGHLPAAAACGWPICAHAVESRIGQARIQSQGRAAVPAERATGRTPRSRDRRFLPQSKRAVRQDSWSAQCQSRRFFP